MTDTEHSWAFLLWPVKRRKRCFAEMKLWRTQWVRRMWGGRVGVRKHKARGLRVWKSKRYEYGGRR